MALGRALKAQLTEDSDLHGSTAQVGGTVGPYASTAQQVAVAL